MKASFHPINSRFWAFSLSLHGEWVASGLIDGENPKRIILETFSHSLMLIGKRAVEELSKAGRIA